MSADNPKYDIALSFLARDEKLAARFYERLSDGFEVFFFPRNQEELAGTDGQESMRTPFREDSRLVVVLYREPWGKTPWTAVENTAIKDRGLVKGWDHLFFVALSHDSPNPVWLPDFGVRFNFEDFGFEEAIGAIKARAMANGANYSPLTAVKRAQLFKSDEEYRLDRASLDSTKYRMLQSSSLRVLKRYALKSMPRVTSVSVMERTFARMRYGRRDNYGRHSRSYHQLESAVSKVV